MQSFGAFEILFWQHVVKVLAVLSGLVGVLLLGAHLLKKYRVSRLGAQSLIRILETRYLSPKTTLHLVAVGPARFLLGSTGERLTLLTALPPDQGEGLEESTSGASIAPLPTKGR
jgi:flagellar biogenesis protein FliO